MANIQTAHLGKFQLQLVQHNNKQLPMTFKDDTSGTMQPMDLRVYDVISMSFRHPVPSGRSGVGKLYDTLDLVDGLSVSGANHNVLLIDFKTSFFENHMPKKLTFDIMMKDTSTNTIRHYVGGVCTIDLMNTHPE